MKNILAKAMEMQDFLVSRRRHIHSNPETGMDTFETSAYVKSELEAMGYEPKYIAGTGVTATAGGKKPGKCFLIRADMDALPIVEQADVDYKSKNQNMHACGHDFHTAMLLGAAKILKEIEDDIPGTVKFMFQPAEENLKGAAAMVADGILENPRPDAGAMFHVMTGMPAPTGTILIPMPGPSTSASDWFEIFIKGKGGHGAMPHKSVDPLNVISHLHIALQEINSREIDPNATAVLTVGKMCGGTTSNVIADTAEMYGTIRTYDPDVREFILGRVPQIAKSVAETFRAEAEVNMIIGCPSVVNDEKVVNTCVEVLSEAFAGSVVRMTEKGGGSEDFSFVSNEIPATMMIISAGSSQDGYALPVHHPKVVFDEAVLAKGAAAYAVTALGWLERNA